ncbi:hypothetical protein [Actinophytocola sp. KF-1]
MVTEDAPPAGYVSRGEPVFGTTHATAPDAALTEALRIAGTV